MASPDQAPPVNEYEDTSPSPYRRRDKPVGVRRRRGGWVRRIFLLILLDIMVPLMIAYGTFLLVVKTGSSPQFRVQPEEAVNVTGNRVISKRQIFEALGFVRFGDEASLNLFRLNLRSERQRIEEIPWIKSAEITRIFPNRVDVKVLERTPVAFANVAGQIELVDDDGAFLRMPSKASFDFPVIDGLASIASTAERKERLDRYLLFMRQTGDERAGSGWKVSEADLNRLDDLRILLVQGNQTILVHFGDKDFRQRFRNFLSIVPRALQMHQKIDSMDLRYHNEVVIDPDTADGR
jgi:cell division protein FtsQ